MRFRVPTPKRVPFSPAERFLPFRSSITIRPGRSDGSCVFLARPRATTFAFGGSLVCWPRIEANSMTGPNRGHPGGWLVTANGRVDVSEPNLGRWIAVLVDRGPALGRVSSIVHARRLTERVCCCPFTYYRSFTFSYFPGAFAHVGRPRSKRRQY